MTQREQALIAMLLEDARPSPALARWLETDEGQRELATYRRMLAGFEHLYGALRAAPRPLAYYSALAAPIGRLLVATTDAGLVRVAFPQGEAEFVADLRQRLGADVVPSPDRTAEVVEQLRAYFAGRRRVFDLPVDLHHVSPFHRRVLQACAKVPAGRVVSYGEIARRIGEPRASRAVGQALGRNPVPIVIPCHRVVAAQGIGGYGGGLDIKRRLLRLEGATVTA